MDSGGRKLITQARVQLLIKYPFYGNLLLGLEEKFDIPECDTCGVNPHEIVYNTTWFKNLSLTHAVSVLAHEAHHLAALHVVRQGNRDLETWDYSTDYATNSMLVSDGFDLPDPKLFDHRFDNKSAEEVYSVILKEKEKAEEQQQQAATCQGKDKGEKPGDKPGSSSGSGEKDDKQKSEQRPPNLPEPQTSGQPVQQDKPGQQDKQEDKQNKQGQPSQEEQSQDGQEQDSQSQDQGLDSQGNSTSQNGKGKSRGNFDDHDWKKLTDTEVENVKRELTQKVTEAATIARLAGKLPGYWEEQLGLLLRPKLSPRLILERFVCSSARTDYCLSIPNRRHLWRDMYLPSLKSEHLEMALAVDTSGSISDEEGRRILGWVEEIANCFDSFKIYYFQADAAIQEKLIVETGQRFPRTFKGRGGTDFRPVFEALKDNWEISGLVYATDGFPNSGWPKPPRFPVLWLMTTDVKPPFGEYVMLR